MAKLSFIAGLLLIALAGAAAAWMVAGLFDDPGLRTASREPESPRGSEFSAPAPGRAPSTRIVLSEAQVRSLIAEHVPKELGVSVSGVAVDLRGDGVIRAAIRVPAHFVVGRVTPMVGRIVPGSWLAYPLWAGMVLRPIVTPGGSGRPHHVQLAVDQLQVGSRRLPAAMRDRLLASGLAGALRWPLPRGVDEVTVEPGRLILSGRSSP